MAISRRPTTIVVAQPTAKRNASIRLAAAPREASVAIPVEALIRTGRGDRVVLALGDGRFKSTSVKAGYITRDQAEILDGLREGDRVVASAQFLLDSETSLAAGLSRLDGVEGSTIEQGGSEPIWTEATVNEPPSADGTVNLSHPPIPAIGWPAMTMEFAVDPKVPASMLTIGRRLRVALARNSDGTYRVTAVEPAGTAR